LSITLELKIKEIAQPNVVFTIKTYFTNVAKQAILMRRFIALQLVVGLR